MFATIPKRIISILMVCILSFMLCLAVPKYQVKAGVLGGITIEIGMALLAILGAFGITINLPEGLSDDEILNVLGTILPINKSYSEWKQDLAITEEGKIFASQDLVNQLLDKFYKHNNDYELDYTFNAVNGSVSAVSGVYDAIDTTNIDNSTDYVFEVGDIVSASDFNFAFNGYNFYDYIYLNRFTSDYTSAINSLQWDNIKDYLTNDAVHHFSDHFYYKLVVSIVNGQALPMISFYSINTLSMMNFEITRRNIDNGRCRYIFTNNYGDTSFLCSRVTFNPDGTTAFRNYTENSLYSGNFSSSDHGYFLCSNLGTYGSFAFLSQGAVLNRFWDVTNRSIIPDRIYSYIGSCVGLSIFQSSTATDTITIGLQDDAIDYPVSGTGVVVDTGVIAQDLDGWIEGVQEKVVTRDIPAEGTAARATDFEISKVIAQPTALDFTDTIDYAAEESLPATYSANTNITLLNGIGSFFPFCIPFDLYEIFNGLNAPAQVPRFNWSIDFRSFGMGKHDFVIDLSNFATVCLIFKILTFIGFLIFLTLKTRDLIRG